MIIFHKMIHTLSYQMDFHLIAAFTENASYDRYYKLPFNIITFRCETGPSSESFIRNELDGKCQYVRPGQILFIPCELPVFIHRRPDFICCDLHFTLEHFPGLDLFCGLRKIFDLSSHFNVNELQSIFAEPDPKQAAARMHILVFRICSFLLPEIRETRERRFQLLTRMVRDTITMDWTVEKMAGEAHMSVGAFSREFAANMHCTAKHFLQKEILFKALILLQDPKKNIQSVSKELHFSSPFYFSKFFRKAYGMPPSEYVRRCASQFAT